MDGGSADSGNKLLHVDIHIDDLKPRKGILELLRRLRPLWKEQDIQLKASECLCLSGNQYIWKFLSMNVGHSYFHMEPVLTLYCTGFHTLLKGV